MAFRAVHPNDRPLSSSGTSALRADGQTHDAAYVHGVRIDGTPHPRTWLTAAELDTAAELRFELGTTPGEWGTDEAAVPPSLTRSVEVPDVLRDVLGVGDVPPGFERLVDDRSSSGSVELPTHGVVLRLEQPVDAELYTLTSPAEGDGAAPGGWRLEGSEDGASWEVLAERAGEEFRWARFTRPSRVRDRRSCRQFRLVPTEPGTPIAQLELLARSGSTHR